MHVVVMGCGRVGSTLAYSLQKFGHSVAIIDQFPDAFRRLPEGFTGTTVTGQGFDREILAQAEIERAGAFAAVSSGDNSNILAARVARETFGIENVVARIYDPGRAEVYQRLGIATVGTVRWTVSQIMRRIMPEGSLPEFRDTSGEIVLAEVATDPSWIGTRLTAIEAATGARVGFVSRLAEGRLPERDMVLQEGDKLHLLARVRDLGDVEKTLAQPPED